MNDHIVGELYALGVAACDAVGCSAFDRVEERISVFTVCFFKSFIAFFFLLLVRLVLTGSMAFSGLSAEIWCGAMLSGVIGFVFADMCYFSAFTCLPLRVAMVIYYCNPIVAALLAYLLFGQTLTLLQAGGIAVTIVGVLAVLLMRNKAAADKTQKKLLLRGVLLAALAMIGQASSVIISSWVLERMPAGVSPIVCTQIRQIGAGGAYLLIALFGNKWRTLFSELRMRGSLPLITLGSITGCAIGTTLLLLSIQKIPIGIASAITSVSPIFVLPIAYFLKKEKAGLWEILGIIIAIVGIVLLSV